MDLIRGIIGDRATNAFKAATKPFDIYTLEQTLLCLKDKLNDPQYYKDPRTQKYRQGNTGMPTVDLKFLGDDGLVLIDLREQTGHQLDYFTASGGGPFKGQIDLSSAHYLISNSRPSTGPTPVIWGKELINDPGEANEYTSRLYPIDIFAAVTKDLLAMTMPEHQPRLTQLINQARTEIHAENPFRRVFEKWKNPGPT